MQRPRGRLVRLRQGELLLRDVELIQRHAPKVATPGGVPRADSIIGAVLDTVLHEAGHGIIEMLEIPVLGREEDAADFFSIYLMLQFPPADAKRLIEGVAFNMGSEAREDLEKVPAMFAGPHPPNAQRHYNVLCLAYGADPALFDDAPPAGLPAWRATNSCGDEWVLLRPRVRQADPAACRRGQAARGDRCRALCLEPARDRGGNLRQAAAGGVSPATGFRLRRSPHRRSVRRDAHRCRRHRPTTPACPSA